MDSSERGVEPYRSIAALYLKGLCMGTADAVPGVSGGTVALIVGIYDRLIAAISAVTVSNLLVLARGLRNPRAFFQESPVRSTVDQMDIPFLVVLLTGIFSAVIVLTRVVTVLDRTNPIPMFALFFGLIGASGIALTRELRPVDRIDAVAFGLGVVIAAAAAGIAGTALGHSLPVVFLVGVVAVSAMVLPGLSGSLLLLIFGQYTYMSGTLSAFTDALVGVDGSAIVDRGVVVVTFIAGGVVGVLTVGKAVNWALTRQRSMTLSFLIGLVIGALRAPIREINDAVEGWSSLAVAGRTVEIWPTEVGLVVAAWAIVGVIFVVVVDQYLYRIQL